MQSTLGHGLLSKSQTLTQREHLSQEPGCVSDRRNTVSLQGAGLQLAHRAAGTWAERAEGQRGEGQVHRAGQVGEGRTPEPWAPASSPSSSASQPWSL